MERGAGADTDGLLARWLQCDRLIRAKTAELGALRVQKHDLNRRLLPILLRNHSSRTNAAASAAAALPLKVVERRKYTPLTFGFLKSCLDECIDDAETTDALMQYVRSKRTVERSHDVVHRESPAPATAARRK
jgi:hypothetical protein